MTHQPEVIVFPDIEAELRTYLAPLVSAPVEVSVPNPRPDRFVIVRRTGGTRINVAVEQPMLTIECWGNSTADAIALASLVRAHMTAMVGRVPGVTRYQEFSGPASLPDPASGQARYTWTPAVDVRGHRL